MNYHNITKADTNNGPGLRVVLWVSGCIHHCPQCHNKETWNPNSGILFDEDAKNEIFEQLDEEWCEGLTLSGGDPLYPTNIREIYELCKEVKEKYPNKTIWLYTGFMFEQIDTLKILNYIDVLIRSTIVNFI